MNLNFLTNIIGGISSLITGIGKAADPTELNSRRAQLSLSTFYIAIAFVLLARWLGISESLTLAVLAVGGVPATAFVLGESVADAKRANGQKKKDSGT